MMQEQQQPLDELTREEVDKALRHKLDVDTFQHASRDLKQDMSLECNAAVERAEQMTTKLVEGELKCVLKLRGM